MSEIRQGSVHIIFKMKKLLLLLVPLLIAISCVNTPVCYANSAPPPSILIIVPNAPSDLEITIEPGNIKTQRTDKAFESYYAAYSTNFKSTDYTLKVTTGDRTFEIELGTPLQSYNNIFTLDLENQTLTPGESLSRSVTSISLRIILTLILEGLVFYLFGYRSKRSWLVFLVTNLITQGLLNIWLVGSSSPLDSYLIFSLIGGEILVLIVEMIAFLILIKERSRSRTALYVFLANLLSLILGGYLITVLPV